MSRCQLHKEVLHPVASLLSLSRKPSTTNCADAGELYTTLKGRWTTAAYSFGGGKPVTIAAMAGEASKNTRGVLVVATDGTRTSDVCSAGDAVSFQHMHEVPLRVLA